MLRKLVNTMAKVALIIPERSWQFREVSEDWKKEIKKKEIYPDTSVHCVLQDGPV